MKRLNGFIIKYALPVASVAVCILLSKAFPSGNASDFRKVNTEVIEGLDRKLYSSSQRGGVPFVHPSDDEGRDYYIQKPKTDKLSQKKVFLTFDDGPSRNNTPRILEILNKYNVKGTFFVIGEKAKENQDILKQINEQGMCIVSHTNTHLSSIYKSVHNYMDDIKSCNEIIKSIINKEPKPFIRFPGGSNNRSTSFENMKRIRNAVKDSNMKYIDWNVSSTDAAAPTVATSQIRNNVITQFKNLSFAVVLMHDSSTKTTTVEALPSIIEYLQNRGFVFRTFEDITPSEEAEMIKRGIMNR